MTSAGAGGLVLPPGESLQLLPRRPDLLPLQLQLHLDVRQLGGGGAGAGGPPYATQLGEELGYGVHGVPGAEGGGVP